MSDPELLSGRIEFGAAPAAVRCARRWTAALLAASGPGDLADTAVLLVSELVTNAVRASCAAARASGCPDPGRIALAIVVTSNTVRIEVSDHSRGSVPTLADHAVDREGGRGLQVISALSKRWGWRLAAGEKVVWCELPTGDPTPGAVVPGEGPTGDFSLAGGEDPA